MLDILGTILIGIGVMVLGSGFFFLKKSKKGQYAITWLAISIVMLQCFHVFVAGIINLIQIPVNQYSIGVVDLFAGAFIWYNMYKKKEMQQHIIEKKDIALFAFLTIVVAYFAYHRYGLGLNIHYETSDPATHMKFAMDVVNSKSISGMYYAALNNGLLIEFFSPFFAVGSYNKIMVLSDIINLGLSGLMFAGIVRKFVKDRFTTVAYFVITVMYMMGYPLNNFIFGFVYLGMGVTLIGMLIVLTDMWIDERIDKRLGIVMLSFGSLGVFECYVLFMPVVFFSLLLVVFFKQYRNKNLISFDTIHVSLAIFLMPCVLGLIYTYLGIFSGNTSVGMAISTEGYIYRDLYASFILFIPLALCGWIMNMKQRKHTLLTVLFPMFLVFMVAMLFLGIKGSVSSYYYYKNYYLLWMIVFVLMFAGIDALEKNTRVLFTTGFVTWLTLIALYFTGIDGQLQLEHVNFNPEMKSPVFCGIYYTNSVMWHDEIYNFDKVTLYRYVANELVVEGKNVAPAANWDDTYWFEAISNQRSEEFYNWIMDTDTYMDRLGSEANYVCVLTNSDFYIENQEYFDSLEKIFVNDAGFVATIK